MGGSQSRGRLGPRRWPKPRAGGSRHEEQRLLQGQRMGADRGGGGAGSGRHGRSHNEFSQGLGFRSCTQEGPKWRGQAEPVAMAGRRSVAAPLLVCAARLSVHTMLLLVAPDLVRSLAECAWKKSAPRACARKKGGERPSVYTSGKSLRQDVFCETSRRSLLALPCLLVAAVGGGLLLAAAKEPAAGGGELLTAGQQRVPSRGRPPGVMHELGEGCAASWHHASTISRFFPGSTLTVRFAS